MLSCLLLKNNKFNKIRILEFIEKTFIFFNQKHIDDIFFPVRFSLWGLKMDAKLENKHSIETWVDGA